MNSLGHPGVESSAGHDGHPGLPPLSRGQRETGSRCVSGIEPRALPPRTGSRARALDRAGGVGDGDRMNVRVRPGRTTRDSVESPNDRSIRRITLPIQRGHRDDQRCFDARLDRPRPVGPVPRQGPARRPGPGQGRCRPPQVPSRSPGPVAPSKIMPAPQAPAKVMPAPQAPAKIMPAPQAPPKNRRPPGPGQGPAPQAPAKMSPPPGPGQGRCRPRRPPPRCCRPPRPRPRCCPAPQAPAKVCPAPQAPAKYAARPRQPRPRPLPSPGERQIPGGSASADPPGLRLIEATRPGNGLASFSRARPESSTGSADGPCRRSQRLDLARSAATMLARSGPTSGIRP